MTIEQILLDLKPVKPLSRARLYVYLRDFKIKPLGIRQCPQRFPDDTTQIIRKKLGLPLINPIGVPLHTSARKRVQLTSRRSR